LTTKELLLHPFILHPICDDDDKNNGINLTKKLKNSKQSNIPTKIKKEVRTHERTRSLPSTAIYKIQEIKISISEKPESKKIGKINNRSNSFDNINSNNFKNPSNDGDNSDNEMNSKLSPSKIPKKIDYKLLNSKTILGGFDSVKKAVHVRDAAFEAEHIAHAWRDYITQISDDNNDDKIEKNDFTNVESLSLEGPVLRYIYVYVYTYVHLYMFVYIYVYIYIYINTFIFIYIHVYTYMYIHIRICIYICI
jgi:hypothetical protein